MSSETNPPAIRRGDRVTPAEYRSLLASVAWRPLEQDDDEVAAALAATWNVAARTSDGQLVGLARVLDDGVLYASVWDVIVRPERQRGGIGRSLLAAVLEQTAGRRLVSLISTTAGDALYRSAGFAETDGRSTALFRRAYEPESPASEGSGLSQVTPPPSSPVTSAG